jgi:hypothetical protein
MDDASRPWTMSRLAMDGSPTIATGERSRKYAKAGVLANNKIVSAQPIKYPPGASIPPPLFILCAAKIISKTAAPRGLSGKDITLHKEATAGSLGLIKDSKTTTNRMTKNNRAT